MKKESTLTNGLRVITYHNPHAVSTLQSYYVKAGGNNEEHYPYGTAHFLEHMLFKGSNTISKEEIVERIDEVGGQINASTSSEMTRYYTVTPFDAWKTGANILSDMIYHASFPEEELAKEKNVVIEEIKRAYDDPSGFAFRKLIEELRFKNPERASVLGTIDSVSSITREHLTSFVAEYYQPHNMVYVATGNIDHDGLVSYLESVSPLKEHQSLRLPRPFERYLFDGKEVKLHRETKQAHLRFGIFVSSVLDEELYTADVVANLLGGGMTSRFFKLIREELGLAYTAAAGAVLSSDEGFLTGYVGADPQNVEQIKSIIIQELEKLKTELVSPRELTRVQNALSGRYLISQDSHFNINSNLAQHALFNIDPDPIKYATGIKHVTPAHIQTFANKYFGIHKILFVEISPNA